ncbi:hypothetical protein LOTGIDRAFT_153395 [Lottia gigantea]|uniref:Uncharacterized protein n=1 Tax=Lottia gigantea TaxID=225164 RepID=V4AAW8_LOTGI|nr:hypothetical protein LOTGIDRAFT_153395 [Lottia gigantea]ESO93922.1 hypothetical protein LOTGIDRAFT_153395 [Lottia gigantea]
MKRSIEEICGFLRSIGVDNATILRFRQNRVDSIAVEIFQNTDLLELGLHAMADIAKLRHFCQINDDSSPNDSNQFSERSTERRRRLLEMIRMKENKSGKADKGSGPGRPKKTTRALNIGFRIFTETERDVEGCRIARTVKAPLDAVSCDFTLDAYITEKRIPGAIRFYRLCSPIDMCASSDESTDSNIEELPVFEHLTPSREVMIRRSAPSRRMEVLQTPKSTEHGTMFIFFFKGSKYSGKVVRLQYSKLEE